MHSHIYDHHDEVDDVLCLSVCLSVCLSLPVCIYVNCVNKGVCAY